MTRDGRGSEGPAALLEGIGAGHQPGSKTVGGFGPLVFSVKSYTGPPHGMRVRKRRPQYGLGGGLTSPRSQHQEVSGTQQSDTHRERHHVRRAHWFATATILAQPSTVRRPAESITPRASVVARPCCATIPCEVPAPCAQRPRGQALYALPNQALSSCSFGLFRLSSPHRGLP